jgi:hypothetical protein
MGHSMGFQKRLFVALASVTLFFAGLSGLRAQVAYHFQLPDDIPPVVSTEPGYDILTMDCLAANGYGQWTSSSSTTNENQAPSCFLLTNKLNDMPYPVSIYWDNAQTGVLAAKPFTYNGTDSYPTADVMKVAANLKGNVRYVWIDNNGVHGRNSFYVEGFDPGSSGIDISFSRLPGNDSIVQPAKATGVSVPLAVGHQLVSTTAEPNPLDRVDAAIDASYLYIVWEEDSSGVFSIWGAVVKLSNDSVVMSATKITPLSGSGSAGRRPTVAVDIRNSGSIAPFDVAYLDPTIPSITGNVWWTEYNGTGFTTPTAITKIYSGVYAWISPTHARIVVASEYGVTPIITNQRAVYVIAGTSCITGGPSCHTHLFLDFIKLGTPISPCEYCDGVLNGARPSGCPVAAGENFNVEDNPIWAFGNPYEGSNSNSPGLDFTEFHALYQLDRTGYGIVDSNKPLMIIPGSNVTHGFCVNGNGSSAFYNDPTVNGLGITDYCGAVNQMGVHVHWIIDSSGTNVHYYRRDKREFDQSIEENTLMVDECDVGNAESGVGSSTDTLLSNLILTLYTDPSNEAGLLIASNGWLDFDSGATLNIGSSSESGSDFVNVGTYLGFTNWGESVGNFDDCGSNSWTINFGAGNSLDFYGYTDFYGKGQIVLTGSGDALTSTKFGNYVSSISDPVIWRIHNASLELIPCSAHTGGLTIPINLTATDAIFDFQGNDTSSHNFPGLLSTYCNASYTKCQFIPDSSSIYFGVSMYPCGSGTWDSATSTGTGDGNYNASDYFAAENHRDTFTSCYATIGILIEGEYTANSTIAPPSIVVSKGLFENYGIMVGTLGSTSPWWPISITDATFDHINGQGIIVNLGILPTGIGSVPQRYSVDIENNDFLTFATGTGISGYTPYSSGIMIANAPDTTLADSLREAITVTNNVFESVGSNPSGSIDAAIHFQNATGDIGFNSITADSSYNSKYARGIWNESSLVEQPYLTWTFICSDTVSGLYPTHIGTLGAPNSALNTDWYKGYAKLNFFNSCLYGQVSSINDNGHIDFSTYTDAPYEGVNNSITDLSGVHSADTANPGDDPAQNTFNTTYTGGYFQQIQLNDSAKVYLGLEPSGVSWTVFGENSITTTPYPDGFDIMSTSPGAGFVGDVSNNYWGGGAYRNFGVTASGGYLTSPPTPGSFTCSSGLDFTKKKGANTLTLLKFNKPLSDSNQDLLDDSACGKLGAEEYELIANNHEPQGYDSAKEFLEDCPFYTDAYTAFSDILDAANDGGGPDGWSGFLAFLKQVLYLNPDTGGWYCSDAADMLSAVQNDADAESICRYILSSGKCPALSGIFAQFESSAANGRHLHWLDSVYGLWSNQAPWWNDSVNDDTLAHPFADTAVPTLYQDSLEILLGPQYAGVVQTTPSATGTQALFSAQLIENPVSDDEIDISYDMNRTALVTMQLSDVLGRSVPLSFAKYQLEQAGSHTASISALDLPAGTYYLRITTDVGDAITLKVVKE